MKTVETFTEHLASDRGHDGEAFHSS